MRALVVVVAMAAEFALGFLARGAIEPKPAHLIPPQNFTSSPRTSPSVGSRSQMRLSLSWPMLTAVPDPAAQGMIPDVSPTDGHLSPSAVTPSSPASATTRSVPPAPSTSVGEAEQAGTAWDRLAHCESRGQWHINTGNGYFGGLQENAQFWASYGNPAYARPDLAPKAEQIKAAVKARDGGRGYSPWPQCAKELGLS